MPWRFVRKVFTVGVLIFTAAALFPSKTLPTFQARPKSTQWEKYPAVCYSPECTSAVRQITGISPRISKIASDIAAQENVDVALVLAIIRVESEGKTTARSYVGARGLMQVMPFNYPGKNANDLYIPQVNIKYGIKYLKQCLRTHRNRSELWKYSAYNMGTNNKRLNRTYANKVIRFYRRLQPHVDRLVQLALVAPSLRKSSQL